MPSDRGHAPAQRTPDRQEPSSLWRFSVEIYGRPGVPDACVGLQDAHGVDVNLLLCLLWLANAGCRLNAGQVGALDHAVADWRTVAVRPLRALRRALKHSAALRDRAAIAALRTRVKALELEAERLEHEELQALASAMAPDAGTAPARAAAIANIAAYASALGCEFDAQRVATLLAAMPRASQQT